MKRVTYAETIQYDQGDPPKIQATVGTINSQLFNDPLGIDSSKSLLYRQYLAARRNGEGMIKSEIPDSDGQTWLVRHPDGAFAVYSLWELYDPNHQKRKRGEKNAAKKR